MQGLFSELEKSYTTSKISQKFTESSYEKKFQKKYTKDINLFGTLAIVEIAISIVISIAFEIITLVKSESYPNFKYFIVWAALEFILPFLLFLVGRKYLWVCLQFSNLCTVIITVASLEQRVWVTPSEDGIDCFIILAVLTMTLSTMTYC